MTDTAPKPSYEPITRQRTFEIIADRIRESLISQELRPGDKLPSERILAEQFNVSRPAVREAYRVLEMAGILQMKKGVKGGAFITQGNQQLLVDNMSDLLRVGNISLESMIEARIWIEQVVVRVVCERASPEDIDRLEENVVQAERSFLAHDYEAKTRLNIEFHNLMAEATGNPVLVMIMRSLTDVFMFFARRLGPESTRSTFESRQRLLMHLRNGNVEEAIAETTQNLLSVQDLYASMAEELRLASGRDEKSSN
ncbi:FadR/GntR family transcriptional regulator [Hoeflea poritis]|uniref:FCD domain-containing protein n=1 Tax=Hoeflea poritis TaxID=2993659 RepID=A0ABT4VV01_9HYPH|nr:FCD domain-containing protein [Hoeflea poritis]MDA4848531.1 FCD domain-containing protein [Hoeflea poritis]